MPVQAPDADNPRPVSVTNVYSVPVAAATTISTAGIPASGHPASGPSTAIRLFQSATAAATSPVIDRGGYRGPAALVIANVGTGSPAMSVDLQASVDNLTFYNVAYALVATPNTVAVAQIAITTTATTTYLLVTDQAWRYLKVVVTAVTTETYSATYYQ